MEHAKLLPVAPRTALMGLLDKLTAVKRLIYIHAPAGYGKSFSTRLWLERAGGVSAWLPVTDSIGRRPDEFCERLAIALLTMQPDNTGLREITAHRSFAAAPFESMEHAAKAFAMFNAVELNRQKTFLAIDDIHLITNTDMIKRLPELIYGLPENVTIFILSRAEPPQSFSEYIVKDLMAVVGVEHLKFTESEIKSFFASRSRTLNEGQTQDVMAATGGWAIGLNAILLSDNQEYSGKSLSRYLETFIKEQVWDNWNERRRDFLLRVSVSDEITADFSNVITGRGDSGLVLDALVRENAFISVDNDNVYRFHHLFSDFLRNLLERENEQLKKELYQTAGDWFYSRADYYKAVEYYIKCASKSGIAKGLTLMYNYNSPYANVEETAAIIRLSVNDSVVGEYPFLLETLAWAAFVEGHGEEMEKHLERYFKLLPKAIMQNPVSVLTSVQLRCMDYRNNLLDVLRSAAKMPFKRFARANTPSITQSMPFYHRSGRDFSELLTDADNNFNVLRKTWGYLLGAEYEAVEKSICAGLAYERGNLDIAHELALSAVVEIKEHFAPEIQFCAFMILSAVTDAQGSRADTRKALDGTTAMIERHNAYYLESNYQAFTYRMSFSDGDMDAAHNWLKYSADSPYGHLLFYKLYRHFTTARAYIVVGDYVTAILFLKKILVLCEQYRRPLDIIEANILLAIAYWKKGGAAQAEALIVLERAIMLAGKYGFTQAFANEGAELTNMLNKLNKRIAQANQATGISATQVKTLYVLAMAHAKRSRGLTGGRMRENLRFTERQKEVMQYLCEGLTHKAIGEKLGLKPSAIKSHMDLIYKKLDVTNGLDAMVKIQELGLLKKF